MSNLKNSAQYNYETMLYDTKQGKEGETNFSSSITRGEENIQIKTSDFI